MLVVGVDPDSEKHGFALYKNGELVECGRKTSIEIIEFAKANTTAVFAIEDVLANTFVYGRNTRSNKAIQSRIAMSVGRCQQAQYELMQWLEHYDIEFRLFKPQRGNWAKNKTQFERVTGWSGRSNEDGRSAAFFGYLLVKK